MATVCVCVHAHIRMHVCVCMYVSLCVGKAEITGEQKGETVQLLEIVCSEIALY